MLGLKGISLHKLRDREIRGLSKNKVGPAFSSGVLSTVVEKLENVRDDEVQTGMVIHEMLDNILSQRWSKLDFIKTGGAVIVGDIICGDFGKSPISRQRVGVLLDSLHILTELDLCSMVNDEFPFSGDKIIVTLFRLMSHRSLFERALIVLEEVLLMRKSTFPLTKIHNFQELVMGLSCLDLSSFCRLLAVCVFDPDENGLNTDDPQFSRSVRLIESRRDRRGVSLTALEQNHALICSMPRLVERLTTIIRVSSFAPPLAVISSESMAENMSTTMELLMMLLPQVYTDGSWDRVVEAAENFPIRDTPLSTSSTSRRRNPIHALIAPLLSNFNSASGSEEAGIKVLSIVLAQRVSEVFFVTTALLNGRRKVDLQQIIYDAGIIKEVNVYAVCFIICLVCIL
jgi:hypothetical protein